MSWAQENKFLTGLIGVTVVGAGVLGYLTYDAMGKYDEANRKLEETTAEKKRLESLPIYPNAANLKRMEDQKQDYRNLIETLQTKLNTMEVPEEAVQPAGFQDQLRTAVTNFTAEATRKHLVLPPKFYMGFDSYQSTPPKPEAAPALSRQLKAIEAVLGLLTQNSVLELKSIMREPLPEETGRSNAKAEPAKPGAKKPDATAPEMVTRHPFELEILCEQVALQRTLDDLTRLKGEFLILRNLVVKNEKPNPPTREVAGAESTGEPVPGNPGDGAAAPGGEKATPGITVIVGEERVDANLLLEIADFAEPASGGAKEKPAKK